MAGNHPHTSVKNVVIVGGGSAGWMTAAALSRVLPREQVSVTLIESEEIGVVGVGEATIPHIAQFNRMLGFDEDEFVRQTQATFKLGIEFVDWGRKNDRYFHPFGVYGYDLEGLDFHHYWNRLRLSGVQTSLDDYSLNALAAYGGKFIRPEPAHGEVVNRLAYAFHFDAVLYARFLRSFAQQRGVTRLEGIVGEVEQDSETGFISTLRLQDGREIGGDLFVDCTGFRGVLIEGALNTGYEDWSHYLPVDRAVAVPCVRQGPPEPFTRATAREAGWQWRIPLQHRTGNGYVYSSQYTDQDSAQAALLNSLEGEALAEPRHLRFVTGKRKKFWNRNCVAIGLSAGFMEPLESTSIHLIQSGISKLIALFPDRGMSPVDSDEYNRLLDVGYQHIRDFLILHYVATERDDSPFWNYVRTMDIPDSLHRKLALLGARGRFFKYDDELFSVTSWLAVAAGQGRAPAAYNPIADGLSDQNLQKSLGNMTALLTKTAEALPTHQAFVDRYCKAEDVYQREGA